MRINMHLGAIPKPPRDLLHLWVCELAEEYCVEVKRAQSWMHTGEGRQFVVSFLQSKGWNVTTYTTPALNGDSVISYGFVVADDCEHLVSWKLSHP